jgi:predicted AAA+ superfamily ATPase
MKRKYITFLQDWISSDQRKPLVIRGARQVGKTWLVRYFAEKQGKKLIEINLEKTPQLASHFESNDPKQFLLLLSSVLKEPIDPEKSLLFLDEIQAVPEMLAKLRWLAEDMPQLPVIAAGSLLEFIIEKHTFSMPVGRISYMHMEPLSFEEFLVASDRQPLVDYLNAFEWGMKIPLAIHEELMKLFKEYVVIGGMPAAVSTWLSTHSLQKVSQIQNDLLATYHDDFNKYRGRIELERLAEVMKAVPQLLSEKFVFSKINPDVQIPTLKHSLDLLCKARVCHRVTSCHANGVPLGAGIDKKFIKVIFLDVGLCCASLDLSMSEIATTEELVLYNRGAIAEQVVGQQLRTINFPYIEPKLFYWLREEKGSSAEVDYIIQAGPQVVPVEVKAGSTGTLRSLHLFMGLKKLPDAVRVNSDYPSKMEVQAKDAFDNNVQYNLISIPFYLVGQVKRLLKM